MAITYRTTASDLDDYDDVIVWSPFDRSEPNSTTSATYDSLVSDCSHDFVMVNHPLSPGLQHKQPFVRSDSRPSHHHAAAAGAAAAAATTYLPHTPITDKINGVLTEQVANLRISGHSIIMKKKQKKENKKATEKQGNPTENNNDENQTRSKRHKNKAKQEANATPIVTKPATLSSSSNPAIQAIPSQTVPVNPGTVKKKHRNKTKKTVSGDEAIAGGNVTTGVHTSRQADVSEVPSLYEEASTFISRYLSNPDAKNDSVCRLTLLQSLIIELGLATSNLPTTLRSARAFLKARAFLNIREYIALRDQGPEAIRRAMFPSRSALVKSIGKNKKNRAPLRWVKEMGLQVLLVGWMR